MNSLSNTCSEEESALAAQHSTKKKKEKANERAGRYKTAKNERGSIKNLGQSD